MLWVERCDSGKLWDGRNDALGSRYSQQPSCDSRLRPQSLGHACSFATPYDISACVAFFTEPFSWADRFPGARQLGIV